MVQKLENEHTPKMFVGRAPYCSYRTIGKIYSLGVKSLSGTAC